MVFLSESSQAQEKLNGKLAFALRLYVVAVIKNQNSLLLAVIVGSTRNWRKKVVMFNEAERNCS